MATITNVKLIVGKTTDSNKEFVQVNFDLGFNTNEKNYADGFRLTTFLYSINGNLDNYYQNYYGNITTNPHGTDQYDKMVGTIKSEIYHPQGTTDHIEHEREWDFGTFAPGEERFRAIISITPYVPGISPRTYRSAELKIDVG